MAKTRAQLQAAVNEIREVCLKHGIVLIGGCMSEGVYGEITLHDAADEAISGKHDLNVVQVVPDCYNGEPPFVYGIGDINK